MDDTVKGIDKNIEIQKSHRRQALEILGDRLGFEISQDIEDAIKVIVVKTFIEKDLMMTRIKYILREHGIDTYDKHNEKHSSD